MAGLFKTSLKVLVGSAAVYISFSEGVWSTGSEGSEAAQRLRNKVLPDTSHYWNKVPSKNSLSQFAVNKWNSGVEKSFDAISAAPDAARRAAKKVKEQLAVSS